MTSGAPRWDDVLADDARLDRLAARTPADADLADEPTRLLAALAAAVDAPPAAPRLRTWRRPVVATAIAGALVIGGAGAAAALASTGVPVAALRTAVADVTGADWLRPDGETSLAPDRPAAPAGSAPAGDGGPAATGGADDETPVPPSGAVPPAAGRGQDGHAAGTPGEHESQGRDRGPGPESPGRGDHSGRDHSGRDHSDRGDSGRGDSGRGESVREARGDRGADAGSGSGSSAGHGGSGKGRSADGDD